MVLAYGALGFAAVLFLGIAGRALWLMLRDHRG